MFEAGTGPLIGPGVDLTGTAVGVLVIGFGVGDANSTVNEIDTVCSSSVDSLQPVMKTITTSHSTDSSRVARIHWNWNISLTFSPSPETSSACYATTTTPDIHCVRMS